MELNLIIEDIGDKSRKNLSISDEVEELQSISLSRGLPDENLESIANLLLTIDYDTEAFKKLVLCLVPEAKVSDHIPVSLLKWVLNDDLTQVKIEKNCCILDWITLILDFGMAEKAPLEQYYSLIFFMLDSNAKSISRLLFLLTKREHVTEWRADKLNSIALLHSCPGWICDLLSLYKSINNQVVAFKIPKSKEECADKFFDSLYNSIKEKSTRLKGSKDNTGTVLPYNSKRVKKIKGSSKIDEEKFDTMKIKGILDVYSNLKESDLNIDILSLLSNEYGMWFLVCTSRTLRQRLLHDLYDLLDKVLIKNDCMPEWKKMRILNGTVRFHEFCGQGFLPISKIIRKFIERWDGEQYKGYIYKFIRWFTCNSFAELRRYILKPLYTLFISSTPEVMCELLTCITDLSSHLFDVAKREMEEKESIISEDDIKLPLDELVNMLDGLSNYFSELCNAGLLIYPCDNQFLYTAITYYQKMFYFERKLDTPHWSIVPGSVVSHTLLSCNLNILDNLAHLLYAYETCPSVPHTFEKDTLLNQYMSDIQNFLWDSKAFKNRTSGFVFNGLSASDIEVTQPYVNLNNSFDLTHHIMLEPYRCLHKLERNMPSTYDAKMKVLNEIEKYAPKFVRLMSMLTDKGNLSTCSS